MILTFDEFINEKMGVLLRTNQEDDVLGVSKIVNSFMDNISKNPNDKYSRSELILNQPVKISYDPKPLTYRGPDGVAKSDEEIVIYKKILTDNYLEVKYFLVHELVHIIQNITSSIDYKNLSDADRIKFLMVRSTTDDIVNNNSADSLTFVYMLYRSELGEIFAWTNNAYEKAFQYKKNNPNASNQDVVKYVLKKIKMTKALFDLSLQNVHNDDDMFMMILSILVGNFSQLSDIKTQSYFDKSIFKLPIILKMRNQLSDILHNYSDIKDIVNNIIDMIQNNMSELDNIKDIIIDSFVKHMKYWFEKIQNKLGKAIQLGIEDATEN